MNAAGPLSRAPLSRLSLPNDKTHARHRTHDTLSKFLPPDQTQTEHWKNNEKS